MKIKTMTATFGNLERAELKLDDGLTVITAPNESGKSTWAGFVKAMLFGIDTKERDKAGFLADKNRYQPWSGAPMEGEMQVEWEGKEITLRRFALRGNPFGGFEAVYTSTGDPVPGLTAANVGETLTGAGKEVFLRSAFVSREGAAVTPSGELEARIAALATAGQEDASFSGTERTLKDWRNRRRANRSTGAIPQLEGELRAAEERLEAMKQAKVRRAEAEERLAKLEEARRELTGELELWRRIETHDLNRRYGQALEQVREAEEALDSLTPPDPEIADWTVQEIRDWAAAEEEAYRAALAERDRLVEERAALEGKIRRVSRLAIPGAVCFAVLAIALAFLGWREIIHFNPDWCLWILVASCACLLWRNQTVTKHHNAMEEMEIPEEPEKADWQGEAQRHADYLALREQKKQALHHARQRAEDLAAQGGTPYDTLELLRTPDRSSGETEALLRRVEEDLRHWQRELSRTEGVLQQMGDGEGIEERRWELEEQLARRTEEYDAITVAMDALCEANAALRERFSPALNQTAGEIFSSLTGGRWNSLTLGRDFSARAARESDLLPRADLALSTGTAGQLYLALRLAICRLTLSHSPVLLDDALTAFDDERMALALETLRELGKERQIILFSCHSREARWAEENGVSRRTLD